MASLPEPAPHAPTPAPHALRAVAAPSPAGRPAERPRYEDAAPVLKWAGGKTRLLPELISRLPDGWERYLEPFFGGGALFFRLQPSEALISDVNEELVNVYEQVRDHVDELIENLQHHLYEKAYYYRMRGADPARMTPLARASRTIYLNRTCFNGLYRVNRRGRFNVPIGRYKNPVICQEARLRACSALLKHTDLRRADYLDTIAGARAGDFIYLDPPYQPLSPTSSFTSYTAGAFTEEDQARLAEAVHGLADRGVRCMVSNSDTPLIRELYEGLRVDVVLCARAISRVASGRGPVREVIVRNY